MGERCNINAVQTMERKFLESVSMARASTILQVAQQGFKRDPTPEELKQFTIIENKGMIGRHDLTFNGILLGHILEGWQGTSYKVDFIPTSDYQ